jgi:hypothetical protein
MIIHLAATAETGFNSVERLVAYAKIAQEAPSVIPDNRPPASWPPSGEIKFEDVSMKYRDDLPPVLKNVTFTAKPGEKVRPETELVQNAEMLLKQLGCLAPFFFSGVERLRRTHFVQC